MRVEKRIVDKNMSGTDKLQDRKANMDEDMDAENYTRTAMDKIWTRS